MKNLLVDMTDFMQAAIDATPYVPTITGPSNEPEIVIDGRKYIQFCSSNYLGLAGHIRIKQAAEEAIRRYGVGTNGSRLISGTLEIHRLLENRIAEFKKQPAAIVFNAGIDASMGILQALLKPNLIPLFRQHYQAGKRMVYLDKLAHQSLHEGARLAGVETRYFPHNNVNALAQVLDNNNVDYRLVVVDGLYSADGDVAPLKEMTEVCEQYEAVLFVDDAHGIGVLGEHGRGSCELLGIESHPLILQMGTLSKAFGAGGGFLAGPEVVVNYLRVGAPTYMFTASLTSALAAAAYTAIEVAQTDDWRRKKVLENADYLRRRLVPMGFDTGDSVAQIVPVILGDEALTRSVSVELRRAGVYAPPLEYPAAPKGLARIRLSTGALHAQEHLDKVLDVFAGVSKTHEFQQAMSVLPA